MNRFTEDLREKLNKTRAPITTGIYIRRLTTLNEDKPLQSMKFLMDFDSICDRIKLMNRSLNTETSYLTAISAVLSLFPKYRKLYKRYQGKMIENANIIKAGYEKNEKNDKQKESIVPLAEVIELREKLKNGIDLDNITKKNWNEYLGYVLLNIYTLISPRRNKDYAECFVTFDEPDKIDLDKNYYVVNDKKFIFNCFKTVNIYGTQTKIVTDELAEIIEQFIKVRLSLDVPINDEFPLLVNYNGTRLHTVNGITRILNGIFGKNIGSSALRHIFLTDKFGALVAERKELADEMAHSIQMSNQYVVN